MTNPPPNPPRRRARRATGFTAVELLATALLLALLGVATLRIATTQSRARQHDTAQPPWPAQLESLLRHDLANATALRPDPPDLLLATTNAIDPTDPARSTLRPVTVRYTIQPLANHPWLLREQLDPAAPPGQPRFTRALLAPDIAAISATTLNHAPLPTQSLPPALQLTLTSTHPQTPPLVLVVAP